jgi:hypothetical protein
MSAEPTPKQAIAIGIVAIVLGAGTAAAIYLHPQALNAPAWVAYAAVATFPLTGAALIAGAMGAKRLVQALGVLITLGLLVPSLWIALGPGAHDCSFSLGFLGGAAPDLACRVGFGLGSLLCLFFLVLLIRASLGLAGPSARERHD